MPATERKPEFQALCHEHHVKMKLRKIHLRGPSETPKIAAYACTKPACHVHYNDARGYFMPDSSRTVNDSDMLTLPRVRCRKDGTPMYLAAVNSEMRCFRLWVCPQCDARHTNEEDLVGLEP
jgi:hypothetical protein